MVGHPGFGDETVDGGNESCGGDGSGELVKLKDPEIVGTLGKRESRPIQNALTPEGIQATPEGGADEYSAK